NYLAVGLTTSRTALYHRIDARVDSMVSRGLVDEVRNLVAAGYGLDLSSMSGLGYRQIGMYLVGEIDLPAAIQRIKYDTHRFARHQYSWFSLRDNRIRWFDVGEKMVQGASQLVQSFVTNQVLNC
ncbi:MAG: tRNA dimethylallyltransferase, partial [Dehalococcoidia bacterium]